MNNVLRFPGTPKPQQIQAQPKQNDTMQVIFDRYMHGIQPEQILDQMAGPEVRQAKQIIHGKSPSQLKGIAMNMAKQRGVDIKELAAQFGMRLPD